MIDGQPREGAPLRRDRCAGGSRRPTRRRRGTGAGRPRARRPRGARARTRGSAAAAGCRSPSASTCRAARGRVHDERERSDRADGVDDDERDVRAQRRAQSPSDERVGDDHGGQHEPRAHRTACARAPRRAIASHREQVACDRRAATAAWIASSAQTNAGYATTSVRRNDDSVIHGHGDGRHRDDERAASAFAVSRRASR